MTYFWHGDASTIAQDEAGIQACLGALNQPCYVLDVDCLLYTSPSPRD